MVKPYNATETTQPSRKEITPLVLSTKTKAPSATNTPELAYLSTVSLSRQSDYDKTTLKQTMIKMLDEIGGISDIVPQGAHVGIKLNLTGGTWWDTPDKPPANEYFVSHPAVAEVLAELFIDAGAAKITMMDGLGDKFNFRNWGFEEVANRLGINLVDLCEPAPYKSFIPFPIGDDYLIYSQFLLHPVISEVDTFVSLAKLKVHATAGVTLSMKNLIGLAPISAYRNNIEHNNRSAFHGNAAFDERLPKVIIDLNKIRPIDLGIIDGIATAEGGAGPWENKIRQIKPGVLLAGKDPLALDSVGTMVMGFDPFTPGGEPPFSGGLNHLILAHEAGLGTMDLSKVRIAGEPIQDVKVDFLPAG